MPGSSGSTSRPAAQAVAAIRARFPALERRHGGLPVAYFDGPGGTQVPRSVVDAVQDYLFHHNGNTHWQFPTSAETDAMLAHARKTFADFFHCAAGEVVFGANMTTLTLHVSRALGSAWGVGDEIVVTELDHHANVAPWRRLARERDVIVRTARMLPQRGVLDMDHLRGCIGANTRLVAIGAASNALGTVSDVAGIVRMARDAGALTFVDAVHYAPHVLPDVGALGCDFLACSAYKFYGTHVGVMFGRAELLASLDVAKLEPAPDNAPDRVETGTPNFEGIAGAAAAVDFLASLTDNGTRRERLRESYAALHARGEEHVARLWRGLSDVAGVTCHGPRPGEPRTPTVAFTVAGLAAADVARRLAERGVFVSDGHFYAPTVVERLGVEGLVRVGCACYTGGDEVERLIEGVHAIVTR